MSLHRLSRLASDEQRRLTLQNSPRSIAVSTPPAALCAARTPSAREPMQPRTQLLLQPKLSMHLTSAVLSDAGYFAKRGTLSPALGSSSDAGRGVGRVG